MELMIYLLEVSVCTALFFAFYLLVLSKLTFFKTNRFYLLLTLLLSFVIPMLNFTIEHEVEITTPVYNQIETGSGDLTGEPITELNQFSALPFIEARFDYYALLPYLYFAIVLCLLVVAIWRIFQLLKHTNGKSHELNGLKIVQKSAGFTNCSFFNYVFIDENLTENEVLILLKHEEVHAKQFHSIDKVFMMIVKAFLWFNPIVYFYDKAFEQAHEYEADEATSKSFGTTKYANLLLRLAVVKSEMPLVHNFVKSPIKKRIKMLFNSKSKNRKKLMYLLALPVGLGLLWGFTVKVVEVSKVDELSKENLTAKNTLSLDKKLWGKTLKGKVKSILETEVGEVLNFKYDDKLIRVYNSAKGKVSVGDEVYITIQGTVKDLKLYDTKGNILKELDAPCFGMSMMKTLDGKLLFDRDVKTAHKNIVINDENPITTQSQQLRNLKKPVLISSTYLSVDHKSNISYIKNGKMKINDGILLADELRFDQKNKKVIAKQASFTDKNGQVIIGDSFTFDYEKGTYYLKPLLNSNNAQNEKAVLSGFNQIQYSASDSTIVNKLTGDIFLYGKAKFVDGNHTYQADRMIYNKSKNTLKLRNNVQVIDVNSKISIMADSLDRNLATGKGIFYGKVISKH